VSIDSTIPFPDDVQDGLSDATCSVMEIDSSYCSFGSATQAAVSLRGKNLDERKLAASNFLVTINTIVPSPGGTVNPQDYYAELKADLTEVALNDFFSSSSISALQTATCNGVTVETPTYITSGGGSSGGLKKSAIIAICVVTITVGLCMLYGLYSYCCGVAVESDSPRLSKSSSNKRFGKSSRDREFELSSETESIFNPAHAGTDSRNTRKAKSSKGDQRMSFY